jgi:PKD repeat protein
MVEGFGYVMNNHPDQTSKNIATDAAPMNTDKNRPFFRCSSVSVCGSSVADILIVLVAMLMLPALSKASWFDSAWQYRRPIQIIWDDNNASGEDMASCVFYTDGHALPNGEDVRVATEDGKLVASHILTAGPGDRIRVVFSMLKNVRDYEIYFGNPKPASPPAGLDDVHYKSGVLIETKQWTGGAVTNFEQMEKSWERSKPVLGKMMVDRVFLGYNPFGPQEQWISKFTGSLFAPLDGNYMFAVAADDVATLYIDGKPLVFAPLGGADIRYNAAVHLSRGRHDLRVYHVNFAGPGYVSLGWRRPDTAKVEVISRESFGICYSGLVGPMEEHNKTLVADFIPTQESECFFNDSYSYRYSFNSRAKATVATRYHWDFGDGQSSDENEPDHVYLVDGIYAVKMTATAGGNSDTQTCMLAVSRNYAHIIEVKEESPQIISGLLQMYDLNAVPADQMVRLMELHLAADRVSAALPVAMKLAAFKTHADVAETETALLAISKKLEDSDKVTDAVAMWDKVPADADIQPLAARHAAELALWWTGDFAKAVNLLKPYEKHNDPQIRRLYADALILSGSGDQGRKILGELGSPVPASRKAALSGAAARTVEFFITEKDAESGEEAWDRWQIKFPTDFEEGYSVVLRTKLMELRRCPQAAAKLAEAFANAQPLSPYAPQLLDKASKLLVAVNPPKSQALRQLLKQKYPEDPLSQN